MTRERDHIDAIVCELQSVRDDELAATARSAEAEALFQRIVATPPPPARRPPRMKVPALLIRAAALAAVLVAALAIARGALVDPAPAAAGVRIDVRERLFVATVTDMRADPEAMRAAFRQMGLDIRLTLAPVSPSLVGQIVRSQGGEGIEHLRGAGAGCPIETLCGPIGLRIPREFDGQAEVVLGREAQAGEEYVSSGDAFAPGEPLHCVRLVGERVRVADATLERRGLTVMWNVVERGDARNLPAPTDVLDHYVTDATAIAPGKVIVFTDARPPEGPTGLSPEYQAHLDSLEQGC